MKRTLSGHFTATLFFLSAAVALPLISVLSVSGVFDPTAALTVYVILLYASVHLTILIARGEKRPIQGVFWIFTYVTMGVAPFAQIVTGQSQFLADPSRVLPAYGVVITGLLAYDLGTWIAKSRQPNHAAIKPPRSTLNTARLRVLSWLVLGYSLFTIYQRGIGNYFTSRQENAELLQSTLGQTDGQAVSGILTAITNVAPLIVMLCWVLVAGSERATLGRVAIGTRVWLLIWVPLNLLVINNPIVNSRFWFLTVAVSLMFTLPWIAAGMYRLILIGGVLGAVLVFPLSDVFRVSSENRALYGYTNRGILENLANKDYDQLVMIANGLWYVDERGLHLGSQMLGNFLFFIPRSIWPTKPMDTGVEIGLAMGVSNVNLSSPLWIELYTDLGIIAVALGFLAVGYGSWRGDNAFFAMNVQRIRNSAAMVIVPVIAGYEFILLRGPLLQASGRLAVMVLLIWFLFSGRARATSQEPARQRRRRSSSLTSSRSVAPVA